MINALQGGNSLRTFSPATKGFIMKTTLLILTASIIAPITFGGSIADPINEKGYGTISGRIQSLTLYRDFESIGKNGANSTLGAIVNYTSPQFAGFDAGIGYNYAGEVYDHNASAILANDDINILNEGWVRLNFEALNFSNTTVVAGRKINNGEVFRADDFRQKSRSIEAVQLETKDIPNTRALVGHAIRMSNWIQAGDKWEFNNFGDVFTLPARFNAVVPYDTDGVTWGEMVNTSVDKLEVALFDAYAWDVANLIGTRVFLDVAENSSLHGYYRNEASVGKMAARNSNAYGLSLQQKVGSVTIEPGYFGIRGDDLLFQELTTGINHPLGASMEICSCQFAGESDTAYIKAVTKLESTKTVLYALYNFTWHDHSNRPFNGQELNVVVKQPVAENLTIALKHGTGLRDGKNGTADTTDTDTRLFITYTF
jgi:hypothetical protein